MATDEQDYQDYLDYQDYQDYLDSSAPEPAPVPEPPGWFDTLTTSAGKGIGNVVSGIGGLVDSGEDFLGTGTNIGRGIINYEEQSQAPRRELLGQVPSGSPQDYANKITEGVTSFVPSLASGAGALGLAGQQFGLGFGNQYANTENVPSSLVSGGVSALTSLPVLQNAQSTGPLWQKALFGAGVGGAGGAVSTLGQAYADSIASGEPVKPWDVKEALPKNVITGALTGGLTPLAGKVLEPRGVKVNTDQLEGVLRKGSMGDVIVPPDLQSRVPDRVDIPEAPKVTTVTETVKLPGAADQSFPTSVLDAEVKSKQVAEPNVVDVPPVENPIETSKSNWEKLSELAKPLTNSDVTPLSPDQAYFEGQVFGRDIPVVSSALSKVRSWAQPKTVSDKFPEVKDMYYKGGRSLVETERSVAQGLSDKLKPYFEADNPELVDAYLGKAGELSKEAARSGNPIPQFSDEVLKATGMSDKDIAAVKSHREAMNSSLDTIEEALLSQGRKVQGEENKLAYAQDVKDYIQSLRDTNYFPARRYGDSYAVVASNPEGITTYRAHFDSVGEARKAVKDLSKKGQVGKIEKIPHIDDGGYSDLPANIAGAIKEFNPEKWTTNAETRPPKGFTRHLIEANKTPGYDANIRKSTVDYVLGASKFAAREKANAILDQLESALPDGNLKAYVKKYRDETLIKPVQGGVKAALKFSNLMNLAAVPSSAITNLSQTFTNTLPKLTGESIKTYGYVRGPIEVGIANNRAIAQSFAYLADRVGGKWTGARNIARKADPTLFSDLDKASKIGIVDAEGLSELYNLKRQVSGTPSMGDSLMFMFSAAEKANRLYAFTAAREIGKGRGLKGDALFDYAKNFTETTQFDNTVANRSPALNNGLARAALQYKPFALNYIRFLRDNFNAKDAPVVALSLAATMGVGGAIALPFAKETERIAEALGVSPRRAVNKFFTDEKWANSVMYGLPTRFGWDASNSVSTGEFIPSLDLKGTNNIGKLLGPTGDYFMNRLPKAVKAYRENDNPLVAAEIAAPRGLRGPLKSLRIATTGRLDDYAGNPIIKDPTSAEIAMIAGGFVPERLSAENRLKSETYKLDESTKSPKDYNTLLVDAIAAKDRNRIAALAREIHDYNESVGPESQVIPSTPQIKKELKGRASPMLQQYQSLPKKARPEYVDILKDYGKLPLSQ